MIVPASQLLPKPLDGILFRTAAEESPDVRDVDRIFDCYSGFGLGYVGIRMAATVAAAVLRVHLWVPKPAIQAVAHLELAVTAHSSFIENLNQEL